MKNRHDVEIEARKHLELLRAQLTAAFKQADTVCLLTRYYEAHRPYWGEANDVRSRIAIALRGATVLSDVMERCT